MKARLMLTALVILMAGITTANGEDKDHPLPGVSLKDYTDHLLQTYGEDATVTESLVTGKVRSGEEYEDRVEAAPAQPLDQPIKLFSLAWWPSTACSVYYSAPGSSTNFAFRFCRNRVVPNYEIQRDYMTFFGTWKRSYADLLDCENQADMAGNPPSIPAVPQAARDAYCG